MAGLATSVGFDIDFESKSLAWPREVGHLLYGRGNIVEMRFGGGASWKMARRIILTATVHGTIMARTGVGGAGLGSMESIQTRCHVTRCPSVSEVVVARECVTVPTIHCATTTGSVAL